MKKLINHPWTIAIGSAIIGVLFSLLIDFIKSVNLLTTLKTAVRFVVKIITSILNFNIKTWWLIIVILAIIIARRVILKFGKLKAENKEPPFFEYTKESLLGFTWEWHYEKSYDGKYSIVNLHPVCSRCGMNLKSDDSILEPKLKCLRCGTSKKWNNSLFEDAQFLIEDNIKKRYPSNFTE